MFDTNEVFCRCTEGHPQPPGLTTAGDGQFHIRVDDQSTLYVNGENVGETTVDQWQQVMTFPFQASCSTPTVYAVDGVDNAGVSAFIGDINHCGEPIQTNAGKWKCSTDCPDGWTGVDFDDSAWPNAVDAGINGVDPWGATDVSGTSHWIWTANTQDDDRACCRYKSTHAVINCNAARTRYIADYPDASLSTQYANAQYQQTGRAEGRIWHSELCNEDGTDVDMDGDAAMGQIHICGDDGYTVYVNEQSVGTHEDYTSTEMYSFSAPCESPTVYALDVYDTGGIASVIADINHCGEPIMTSSAWKCNQFEDGPPDGWTTAAFDDTQWPAAGDAGDNGVAPWGRRKDISDEAHWIWTQDPNGHDHVYCRFVSQHHDYNCQAASARYYHDYRDVAGDDRAGACGHATGEGGGAAGCDAFDHFTRYGKHEGRIWHSELCNDDGTNKNSFCEVKHTSAVYEYDFLQNELGDTGAITFSVRAANDAHIGFFETQDGLTDTQCDGSDGCDDPAGPQYEIILCGWGGASSTIRSETQSPRDGGSIPLQDTTGMITADDFRQFWASAVNGLVRVGAGNLVGSNVIMQWQDPDAFLHVRWAGVATGWGAEGDWVVCLPEKCTGFFNAADALLSGPIICTDQETAGCTPHTGGLAHASDGSLVNVFADFQNDSGDTVTFTLSGCAAGLATMNFRYANGNTDTRPLQLAVNSVVKDPVNFAPTGGWDEGDWRDVHAEVQLTAGTNVVTLTTTGANGPNLSRLEVQSAQTTAEVAVQRGYVFITADNGYIMYVNGERIGAGGAALDPTDARYDRDGWTRVDRWAFTDSCQTPTSFAVEGVDSEGIAAMIVDITHCGKKIYSGDQWKCSPFTAASQGADRTFHAIDQPMNWDAAQAYCKDHYSDLASIHNEEEQALARQACGDIVETDELPIESCSASTEYGADSEAARGSTDDARTLGCVDGTQCTTYGNGADPLGWGCCGPHGGRAQCPSAQPVMCLHAPTSVGAANDPTARDCEANEALCADYGGTKAKQYGCEKAFDNLGTRDEGEWSTQGEYGGFIKMNFAAPTNVCTMMFQQRWAEIDWVTTLLLQFSDGSSQTVPLQTGPELNSYTLRQVTTSYVKITLQQPMYPEGTTHLPAGFTESSGNTGAKEIQFMGCGNTPHGCWIGMNDNYQERRLVWSDGSLVNYLNWAPGEPSPHGTEDVVEVDFRLIGRCEGGAYAANSNNGCETEEFRNGEWNDNQNGGDGNNTPEFALCESAVFTDEIQSTYIGCFIDSASRDMDGSAQVTNGNTLPYFIMGDDASPAACAMHCAGSRYMGLQNGNECYCDNANAMSQGQADEADCNMPCQGDATTMCGGGWRNSIYS